MKRNKAIVIFFLLTGLAACGGLGLVIKHKGISHAVVPGVERNASGPDANGTETDAQARLDFELMRLADPATGKIPANMRTRELAFKHATFESRSANSGTGATFNARGPYNIGGRTRAFAVDIDNDNTIIAGGVTGSMWRSTDGGQTYTLTTAPAAIHSATTIVQDTRAGKHNTWYYGTGEEYAVITEAEGAQGTGNGIYKSTDGGQSWQALASTVAPGLNYTYNRTGFNYVWKVIIDPTDNAHDVVFAAVLNGIYKSIDGGATWTQSLGFDSVHTQSYNTDIVITPTGALYAYLDGTNNYTGFWRSADQGVTWKKITPTGWPTNSQRAVMALCPQDETKLMVIGYSPNTGRFSHNLWHYTYLSGDGSGAGGSWQNRTTGLPNHPVVVYFGFKWAIYDSQDGYDMCLAYSPTDSNTVFLGGTDIFRSTNGFINDSSYQWIGGYQIDSSRPSNYVYPNHHPDQHTMFFSPSNASVLYNSNDGGLFKTLDANRDTVQWVKLNNGYINSQFYAVGIETGNSTSSNVGGGMQDNGSWMTFTDDASVPWKGVLYGDGGFVGLPQGKNYAIAEWEQGRVYKCQQDANGNIINETRIDPTGAGGYLFIPAFILDPTNVNRLYLAAGPYIYVQSNLDSIPMTGDELSTLTAGWTKIAASSIGFVSTGPFITCIGMSAADSTRLYYGSTNGGIYRLDSLYGHTTRVYLNDTSLPRNAYVSSIWVNQSNSAEVIVSFSNYNIKSIFHSTDYGHTWQNISGTLEQNADGTGDGPAVFWIDALDMQDSVIYFAATSSGLYSTTSLNGVNTNWQQESPNSIGDAVVDMVVCRNYDGFVAVGTHGSGVFSARYKNLSGIKKIPTSGFSVTASPNPFTQRVTFNYYLDEITPVVMDIYGMDGKLISSFTQNFTSAGNHTLEWDVAGNGIANGLYFYELTAGGQRRSGKIVLSR